MAENIDFFNRFTLCLLDHLYQAFPTPIDVDAYGLAASLQPDDVDEQRAMREYQWASDAVDFLADENYIRHGGGEMSGGEYTLVQLTSKGIDLMNSAPEVFNGVPLAQRIGGLARAGLKMVSAATVNELAKEIFARA